MEISFSQNVCHSRASNSEVNGPIRPDIELVRYLCLSWLPASLTKIRSKMNVLVWRQHFPIISIWDFFRRSRAPNSVGSGPIWQKLELLRDVMPVPVTCKFEKDMFKNNRERWRHRFPIMSMGALCCHGNQSFDQICTKTLCSLSPTPVMLHIKSDQDWPTGLRDIPVQKCGRRRRTAIHWYTICSPCEPPVQVS